MLTLTEAGFAQVFAQGSVNSVTVHRHFFFKSLVPTKWTAANPANWRAANISASFTQDDEFVYAYTNASFIVPKNFTWQWYDPTGALYTSWSARVTCMTLFCTNYVYLALAGHSSADRLGKWRMNLLADGVLLYSDYFTLLPVINEEDYWYFNLYTNQAQSGPPRAHVNLTVTIHPHNLKWTYYGVKMPYAANITAYDFGTNRALQVITGTDNRVVVDFGEPRGDDYKLVLSFDLAYGFESQGELSSSHYRYRSFNLTWDEYVEVHPVPQKFTIALPSGSTLVQVITPTNYTTGTIMGENRPVVSFNLTAPPDQILGWSIIFYNETVLVARTTTTQAAVTGNYASALALELPILPLTLGDITIWAAIMSLILLTTSELLSPRYGRSVMVTNRRRLRAAALVVTIIFLGAVALVIYEMIV
jgi:hypothetical protein